MILGEISPEIGASTSAAPWAWCAMLFARGDARNGATFGGLEARCDAKRSRLNSRAALWNERGDCGGCASGAASHALAAVVMLRATPTRRKAAYGSASGSSAAALAARSASNLPRLTSFDSPNATAPSRSTAASSMLAPRRSTLLSSAYSIVPEPSVSSSSKRARTSSGPLAGRKPRAATERQNSFRVIVPLWSTSQSRKRSTTRVEFSVRRSRSCSTIGAPPSSISTRSTAAGSAEKRLRLEVCVIAIAFFASSTISPAEPWATLTRCTIPKRSATVWKDRSTSLPERSCRYISCWETWPEPSESNDAKSAAASSSVRSRPSARSAGANSLRSTSPEPSTSQRRKNSKTRLFESARMARSSRTRSMVSTSLRACRPRNAACTRVAARADSCAAMAHAGTGEQHFTHHTHSVTVCDPKVAFGKTSLTEPRGRSGAVQSSDVGRCCDGKVHCVLSRWMSTGTIRTLHSVLTGCSRSMLLP